MLFSADPSWGQTFPETTCHSQRERSLRYGSPASAAGRQSAERHSAITSRAMRAAMLLLLVCWSPGRGKASLRMLECAAELDWILFSLSRIGIFLFK